MKEDNELDQVNRILTDAKTKFSSKDEQLAYFGQQMIKEDAEWFSSLPQAKQDALWTRYQAVKDQANTTMAHIRETYLDVMRDPKVAAYFKANKQVKQYKDAMRLVEQALEQELQQDDLDIDLNF